MSTDGIETMEVTETLVLPAAVVYYNFWTDFESKEIGGLFECMPFEEACKLEEGMTLWIDVEQASGKVYGYYRAEVVSVVKGNDRVSIELKGPYIEWSTTVEKSIGWHKVHLCTDTAKLVELVQKLPLALERGTVGTMSVASHRYLASIGKGIAPA